jgi:aldehyde dehydrogenase (NAD+)
MIASIKQTFSEQLEHAPIVAKTDVKERVSKLKKLRKALLERKEEIIEAIQKDFNKPGVETILTEIFVVCAEIKHTIKHLRSWMKPKKVGRPIFLPTLKGSVNFKPKGVVLIISPWNFPLNLALGPLVSAIAAGNCVMLKPSELSPHTSQFIDELLSELFPLKEISVFQGDKEVAQELLELPFHHIFFTGSPAVGKIVMEAASKNLSDITLELGGKSPAIVHKSANIDQAAKKIAWGKFLNAGQTCVAPDYALVDASIEKEFIERVHHWLGEFKKDDSSYASIINKSHWERLTKAIDEARDMGASISTYFKSDEKNRTISPAVCTNLPDDSTLMQDEIFGPLLPVRSFTSTQQVVDYVNGKERPLALYIFAKDSDFKDEMRQKTIAGGIAINDVILQYTHPNLPFGGVNYSGIGKAHGEWGFKTFSHEQAVVEHNAPWSPMNLLYPPYSGKTQKIANLFLKYFG